MSLFSHCYDGGSRPPLIGRRRFEAFHLAVAGEKVGDGAAENPLTMSMDDANALDSAQVSLVQKFVDTFPGLIRGVSDDLELIREVLIRVRPGTDSG